MPTLKPHVLLHLPHSHLLRSITVVIQTPLST
ncbi:hypothetical protein CIPAW_06G001600 [Carya illinoinensis]|uniref:Uncharacterized protein n=1 Tax=Carya illinoinensis TaxID=32201 RepID=A0A8T1Q5U8_CARIL|nr:hypothetical protein CIPAW_06G001600 [Carya illinoinensis]